MVDGTRFVHEQSTARMAHAMQPRTALDDLAKARSDESDVTLLAATFLIEFFAPP